MLSGHSPSPAGQSLRGASVLLIGPGWLGSQVVSRIGDAEGWVATMHRGATTADATEHRTSDQGGSAAILTLKGDVRLATDDAARHAMLAPLRRSLTASERIDHVVVCVAPSRERGDSYASLYAPAAWGARAIALALGARTLIYTSSTGVYGVDDGSDVDERYVIRDPSDRQRALLDAEDAILAPSKVGADGRAGDAGNAGNASDDGSAERSALRSVVLRVAGLYGPDRDPAPRFSDPASLDDDGAYWCNFAWGDDVASAILHAMHTDSVSGLYNCCDGSPKLARDIALALAAVPLHAPATSAARPHPEVIVRQRLLNAKLRKTGWTPSVPNVFDGLKQLGHSVHPMPAPDRAISDEAIPPR